MTDRREAALVICPGRGTYGAPELGYLSRYHPDKDDLLTRFDALRSSLGQPGVRKLDSQEVYSPSDHTRGDNASALIHACAYADFLSIDTAEFDITAITGNSMGWYIALACAGVLDETGGMHLVNTMGTLMHEALIGGQMIYPIVDENWLPVPGRLEGLLADMAVVNDTEGLTVSVSIALGGMVVIAGNDDGLKALAERLPPVDDRFPMRLFNHAAFHSPLLAPVSEKARDRLGADLFHQPACPVIDGRGQIWRPHSSDIDALWRYTLETQVVEPYNFTLAVQAGLKEFAPDRIIILGPGTNMGGAVAQCLIAMEWKGLRSKADFLARQADDPLVYAMGFEEQRRLAVG